MLKFVYRKKWKDTAERLYLFLLLLVMYYVKIINKVMVLVC